MIKKYSFLEEDAAPAPASNVPLAMFNNYIKNRSAMRSAALGAVAGGTINKMRGGSFTKGAAVGAVAGGYGHRLLKTRTGNAAMIKMGGGKASLAQHQKNVGNIIDQDAAAAKKIQNS